MKLDYSLLCGSTGLLALPQISHFLDISAQRELNPGKPQGFMVLSQRKETDFHSFFVCGSMMSMADHFLCNCHVTWVLYAVVLCCSCEAAVRLWKCGSKTEK